MYRLFAKCIRLSVILLMILLYTSCMSRELGKKTIGISMPTKSSERWLQDAKYTALEFEERGYNTKIAFAEDVTGNQASQIENFLDEGIDLLIVTPIDSIALVNVLKRVKEEGIPIISYDRLLLGEIEVDYYVSFDNYYVGVLQGNYIIEHLDFTTDEPKYIELFAGSPDDGNTSYLFEGALSVLKPYIDSGQIIILSNQLDIKDLYTLRWDKMMAKSRMTSLINTYYRDKKIDAILSPYDGISRGVIEALVESGYYDDHLPIITGQDAEMDNVRLIIEGKQSMTIFKDVRELGKVAATMAINILEGNEVDYNDDSSYYNKSSVKANLLEPIFVDRFNWEEVLVDSGYYTKEEIINE